MPIPLSEAIISPFTARLRPRLITPKRADRRQRLGIPLFFSGQSGRRGICSSFLILSLSSGDNRLRHRSWDVSAVGGERTGEVRCCTGSYLSGEFLESKRRSLSVVDFYVSSGPPSSYRMNSFTFEPDGKILLKNQYGLSWFVSREISFFDGTVDGVVTALG